MVTFKQNLKAVVAATAISGQVFASSVVFAETSNDVLMADAEEVALLEQLAQADPVEAISIARDLESIWRKTGSASMDLLLDRGLKALERGDYQVAVNHLTALTDHAPKFAQGWRERALAFCALEQYGPCISDLETALWLNPNDYEALFALGIMLEQFRDIKTAHEVYLRAKSIHPNHEEVTTALDRLKPMVEGKEL